MERREFVTHLGVAALSVFFRPPKPPKPKRHVALKVAETVHATQASVGPLISDEWLTLASAWPYDFYDDVTVLRGLRYQYRVTDALRIASLSNVTGVPA